MTVPLSFLLNSIKTFSDGSTQNNDILEIDKRQVTSSSDHQTRAVDPRKVAMAVAHCYDVGAGCIDMLKSV